MFSSYRNRRVLITGHTGFKGSWLALALDAVGAKVTGISLDTPTAPNHWDILKLRMDDQRADVRDAEKIKRAVQAAKPEIVFHLAAQSLVRRSYREPLLTWETNVLGTANVLEACHEAPGVKAIVAVTTDKCYENKESPEGYCEIDPLGGHDPYSASKAAAEMVAASYRNAFFLEKNILLATARAGNVIGGGDWSEDRLIPDLARAVGRKQPLEIRSPNATRPWQHVLDISAGYLLLGEKLLAGKKEYAEAWNFGPDKGAECAVSELLLKLKAHWPQISWKITGGRHPHETTMLKLNSGKARARLGWKPRLSLDDGLKLTAEWYRRFMDGDIISRKQLGDYMRTL